MNNIEESTIHTLSKMYQSNRYRKDKINMLFYGRVSTKHIEQLDAYDNQIQYYKNMLKEHTNWECKGIYGDPGKSGTRLDNRPEFMRMIHEVLEGEIEVDLIVTREISRLARNQEIIMGIVRKLRKKGVEVFFANEGLWSFEDDADFMAGIHSSIAQQYSKETSMKVFAGQEISRQKKMLYGTGNIFGYDLVITPRGVSNTYEINPEQAKTVQKIFNWYLEGYGIKKIVSLLITNQCKNTQGKVSWQAAGVGRILKNYSYCGYITYGKSRTIDYLDHTRITCPEEEHQHVKGDWEPIISEKDFMEVQRIRKSRQAVYGKSFKTGLRLPRDKWTKKLVCGCGKRYKRIKWYVKKTGKESVGYQCSNQVYHRKKEFHISNGRSGEGLCDVPSISQWKLEMQCQMILRHLWMNPSRTVETLVRAIDAAYVEVEKDIPKADTGRLEREKERLELRLASLEDKWLDGKIDDQRYQKKKEEIQQGIDNLTAELEDQKPRDELPPAERKAINISDITETLKKYVDYDQESIDRNLVDILVDRVTPTEDGEFLWYLNLGGKPLDSASFDKDAYVELEEFCINLEDAKEYREKYQSYLRARQWRDIVVKVYVRKS